MNWRPTVVRVVLATLLAALSVATASADENLLGNGSFDTDATGWNPPKAADVHADWTKDGGRDGGGALHIAAGAGTANQPHYWWGWVDAPPTDTALLVSAWVRGKGVKKLAAVCVQARDGDKIVSFATSQTTASLAGDFDWTRVEMVLPPAAAAKRLGVLAFVSGPGEVWFDDLSVERTDRKAAPPVPRLGPGLVLAESCFDLVAVEACAAPRVLLPLPLSYREQVPLTWEITTKPAGALAKVVLREDRPGNFVAEATFAPLAAGTRASVSWRSLVLCGERSFEDLPAAAPIPAEWPEETRPWLHATRCVQSDDARIAAIAKELREGTDDAREVVRRVLRRSQEIFAKAEGRVEELTAVEALDKEGSCTSCANLVAALLRASGVPARVLAGYPTWSGPLQTHYIVEAWLPGHGWYPLESTMGREAWQPFQQVEVAVIAPEYEDRSARRPCGAGGVPYLSLTEVPTDACVNVGTLPDHPGCDHVATMHRVFAEGGTASEWAAAFASARGAWTKWLAAPGAVDVKGRFGTTRRPEDVTAKTIGELAH